MKRSTFTSFFSIAWVAIALNIGVQPHLIIEVSAQPSVNSTAQRPPNPPNNPPPNQTQPGGGLNPDSPAIDISRDNSLRALIPVENPVLTTSEHPNFFFYVPFGREAVERAEFSVLLWPGEMERHYKAELFLPDEPGIVRITLPDTAEYALQEGQDYRWYFHVYLQDSPAPIPDLSVNGMVQRVALTPERDRQIQNASPELWHDSLEWVVDQLEASPDDPEAHQLLVALLQHIDAEALAQMPLSGTAAARNE